ncbi:class I adenylate-forming enzyme family protein [Rhodococcus artemisiae]|uniref:Class I adenylate-forming enzyme family protein n=1 Tax=Rhodococcus artemisiae TaxID=714159 RepID=A0ABU7LBT1_9NOCA|nr:class I adenylate-forming enzyme family protein [Rhodococcus artemisiae]MEE2058998.1 class I adenylate-forming enzyme family protein [Rhodococcus artemisiae]
MSTHHRHEGTAPSLGHLMCDLAADHPNDPALITLERQATYGEIWARAQEIATYLTSENIGPDSPVAVLVENSVEWLEIAVGISVVGARLVALSTWVEQWDLERLLASAQPEMLFVSTTVRGGEVVDILHSVLPELGSGDEPRFANCPSLRRIVAVGPRTVPGTTPYNTLRTRKPYSSGPQARPSDIGLILFSSGSTSAPKGVALVNEDIIVNATAIGDRLGLSDSDRLFVPMPFFWAMGGPNGMMAALTHRSTLVTLPKFEPGAALDLFETHRCTGLYTMPNMTRAILDHSDFTADRVSTLCKGITVGSPAEVQLAINELRAEQICNVYGSSELYANATVTPHDAPVEDRLTTNGPPLVGVTIKIVDPDTRDELSAGEIGEICAAGRVAAGYIQPDGSIRPIADESGYFATGDLGFVNERGWLTYVGRATDMIKTRGINVSPVEVEEFLCTNPSVVSALAYGIDDAKYGQALVAVVVPELEADVDEESLRRWCKGKVASYKIPKHVVVVDELPTTQTGKISRSIAKARFHAVTSNKS